MIYQGAIKIKCSWPSLLNIKSFLMWIFDVLWKTYWRSNLSSKQTKVTGKARILLTFYNHHAVTQASLKKNKPKNPVTYDITPTNLHIKVTANMHFSILQASYWVPPFIFIFLGDSFTAFVSFSLIPAFLSLKQMWQMLPVAGKGRGTASSDPSSFTEACGRQALVWLSGRLKRGIINPH